LNVRYVAKRSVFCSVGNEKGKREIEGMIYEGYSHMSIDKDVKKEECEVLASEEPLCGSGKYVDLGFIDQNLNDLHETIYGLFTCKDLRRKK